MERPAERDAVRRRRAAGSFVNLARDDQWIPFWEKVGGAAIVAAHTQITYSGVMFDACMPLGPRFVS